MTLKNEMTVTGLLTEHIGQMEEIERLCFSQPWSRQVLEEELINPFSRYFVGSSGGRVMGYIGTRLVLDECYITNVAVRPEYRRQGVATALLHELEEFARRGGFVFMTLEVRESNAGARAFYAKNGFAEFGRRRGYYILPDEDAILMTKELKEDELC